MKIKELICVLRRFKREVSKAAIFPEIKKHSHFETPIEKHKRQTQAA
ncbi:MAG TPA: 30S ribosomal protein S21 [Leptolyngbyaceae cyanobacterium]